MSRRMRRSVIAFILWNLAVAALWFWSRDGAVVHLRLELDDQRHTLFCDGQLVDSFTVPDGKGSPKGRPGLGFSNASRAPLAVRPQEFDNFIVRDLSGEKILINRTFDDMDDGWFMLRGQFEMPPRGRLRADGLALGAAGDPDWSNYIIDVTCYNGTECFLLYRVASKNTYGRAKLRFWRELVVGFSYYINGQQKYHRIKSLAEPLSDGIKSLVLRFVKVYAVGMLILVAFLILFVAVSCCLRPFMGTRENGSDD